MAKSALYLTGHVLVSDFLDSLEPKLDADAMERVDNALKNIRDERLVCCETEVTVDDALDALDEEGMLPEADFGGLFDQSDIIGLAEAIRIGDREQAELLLDRLFADTPDAVEIREWIDRGRYSKRARDAKAAAVAPELKRVA